MQTLETPRLILRAWRESDVRDLYEYARDPQVGPHAGWEPHVSPAYSLGVIRELADKGEVWAVQLKQPEKVIGSIGLQTDTRRSNDGARMLGYTLSRAYWGQGLISEAVREVLHFAFIEQGLDLVSVWHADYNRRSQKVIERAGFRYEGCLRRARQRPDGFWCGDMCYSMTRTEYLGRQE